MLIDLERCETGTVFEADIAILGAGAAGIAMACRLAGRSLRVLLLESGGLRPEAAIQGLNEGRNLGLPYYPLTESRTRVLGGTTASWSGRNIPLDPIDFRQRSWVPLSGWPLTHEELLPALRDANRFMGVGEFHYENLWASLGLDDPGLDPSVLQTRFWRIRTERLGERHHRDLAAAPDVRVLLHGTATELVTPPGGGAVDAVRVQTLGGRQFTLRAGQVVLATGGIENARLLLASDRQQDGGLGNGHGWVGRCFMEHPKCRTARIEAPDPYRLLETWRRHYSWRGPDFWPSIVANEAVQERLGILNSSLALYFRTLPGVTEAASRIGTSLKARQFPRARDLLALAPVAGELPANLVRRFVRRRSFVARPTALYVLTRAEQAPNPDSRVRLSRERDALGQRRADLDWRLSTLDKHSAAVMTDLLRDEFARLGLGAVTPDAWLSDGTPDWPGLDGAGDHHAALQGGHHHIGTTRMAASARDGVVDRDCRVFGLRNLWIAGSSVFPTSGWANPTLTIVALALRLAEELAGQVRRTDAAQELSAAA